MSIQTIESRDYLTIIKKAGWQILTSDCNGFSHVVHQTTGQIVYVQHNDEWEQEHPAGRYFQILQALTTKEVL